MSALEYLFPAKCACCAGVPDHTGLDELCSRCALGVAPIDDASCPICALPGRDDERCVSCTLRPPPFLRAVAAFEFSGAIADTVRRAKYGPDLPVWRSVVGWATPILVPQLEAWASEGFVVTWVPMASRSARRRGFDPPAIALEWMGFRPEELLRHGSESRRQAGLAAPSRLDHARVSFETIGAIPPKVCLFDDVVTTGATMRACSEHLIAAGASEVVCAAIARTPRPHD